MDDGRLEGRRIAQEVANATTGKTKVKKNGTSKQAADRKQALMERDQLIRDQIHSLRDRLFAIEPPEDHRWELRRGWDTWFAGDLEASARNGVSFMLRSSKDTGDPDQLHAEIRIFRGVLQDFAYRPESAIVWFERGGRFWGNPRLDHVAPGSTYHDCEPVATSIGRALDQSDMQGGRHLYAGTWESMCDLILRDVNRMMAADLAHVAGNAVAAERDSESASTMDEAA